MTRTVGSGLQLHFDGSVARETTLWRVTRQDGVVLRLTSHDQDVVFGGNTYSASVGYQRTDLASGATLAVNSVDIQGILNAAAISDTDLAGGRYDYAEVRVSIVNWEDPDGDGEVSIAKGWFGEVVFDEVSGSFTTELRGLTQVFSQTIIEQFGRQCRYDIGNVRCTLPILPPVIQASTAYAVGDVVRVRKPVTDIAALHAPGAVDDDDDSQFAAVGTTGSDAAAADTDKLKNLAGNFRFQPVGGPTQNPSNSFVSWPDAAQHTIGLEPFTIEMWANFDALDLLASQTGPVLASKYTATGGQISWMLLVVEETDPIDGLRFIAYDGISALGSVAVPLAEFTPLINQWYHITVTRDEYYRLRIFVNGKQRAVGDFPFDIFGGTAPVRLGARDNSAGFNRHFEGSIEDFRVVIGDAVYTEEFTPPGALASTFSDILTLTEDYQDTNYRVTKAGTTSTGVDNFPTSFAAAGTAATTISVDDNNTFSRASGSFIDDGWEVDMVFRGSGFANGANNAEFRITAVNALTMDVAGTSAVAESGNGDEALTHIAWNNGVEFVTEPALRVAGEVLEVISPSEVVVGPPTIGGLLTNALFIESPGFEEIAAGTYSTGAMIGGWEVTGPDDVEVQTARKNSGAVAMKLPQQYSGSQVGSIQQSRDVSSYASLIDGGAETVTVSWWTLTGSLALGDIWVDFVWLDENDSVISSTTGTRFDPVGGNEFAQVSQQNTIPALTRKIVIEMNGTGGTFEGVADDLTVSTTLIDPNFPDDEFNYGVMTWDTGLNAGISMDVKNYNGTNKQFTLYLPMPFAISVGDKVGVHIGCNKELSRCTALGNVLNHGGFPFIPGDDEFLRYPDSPY